MAKSTSQILASLEKLYDKRAALDKQIALVEKNLIAGVEKAPKTVKTAPAKAVKKIAGAVKKPAGKPRGRKPAIKAE